MEPEHERLARTLGSGHQLLRGVTGSGKTRCLLDRARRLRQQHPDWRILIVCFNGSLAGSLRRALDSDPNTDVHTFHTWAYDQLVGGGVPVPDPPGRGALWDRYWTGDVARLLLDACRDGRIPPGTSQAVLVDEGQDFAGDWYRALLHALDDGTASLLVALDPSQNIFGRRVNWREIGIESAGATHVLATNHRNTGAILSAAYAMIRDLDAAAPAPGDSPDACAVPDAARPGGTGPDVRRCASFGEGRDHALAWVRDRLARGTQPADILVLGLSRLDMITVNAWLNSKHVPAWMPSEASPAAGVRVSTIHGAKGLEADSVLLLDAHHLESREDAEARRLLYIAMTRARQDLCVSYFRPTPLMQELARVSGPA